MTTQTDALPACPHGNEAVLDRGTSLSGRPSHRIRTLGACDCRVFSGDEQSARAVAERVMERARVCSWCHGSGLHPGPYDDVPTCDRCAGRGVTFGGEA